MAKRPIFTLTTDFGLSDPYVGVLKGVILSRIADATIVDLTHQIPPQDIQTAALTLQQSIDYFPEETVHIVIVDPGVGSDRDILGLRNDKHFFVGPDNGVLSPFFKTCSALHRVTNKDLFLTTISSTFHGRDIMAPIATHLATGQPIEQIGPSVSINHCKQIDLPTAQIDRNSISGTLIHIDIFGNLRSSITAEDLKSIDNIDQATVSVGFHTINKISTTYSDGKKHETLALLDSNNHLEIAVKNGNAAKNLDSKIGDRVVVRW